MGKRLFSIFVMLSGITSNALADDEITKVFVTHPRQVNDRGDPSSPGRANIGSLILESPGEGDAQGDPPSDANSNAKDCESKTENPVVITTGEKYKNETDFVAAGQYNLGLSRIYRSAQSTG
jgi:hypothetical protein